MTRRSAPTAGKLTTRPIEVLPRTFFLVIVRETPRMSVSSSSSLSTPSRETGKPRPLVFPSTPGIQFIELDKTMLSPTDQERKLDAAHTIRFCRFMNTLRRKHSQSSTPAAVRRASKDHDHDHDHDENAVAVAPIPQKRPSSASQIHFFVRSRVRGDEAGLVELLIRWRLLSLHLSPDDALAPFSHLQSLFCTSGFGSVRDSLAGIAKGVAMELLFPRQDMDACNPDAGDDDGGERVPTPSPVDYNVGLIRITKRFVVFASPVDRAATVDSPRATTSELERPPTGAIAIATLNGVAPMVLPSTLPSSSRTCKSELPIQRLSVAQLVPLLSQQRVAMVVKLNAAPHYDDQLIIRSGGIDHLDLSSRSDVEGITRSVVARFLESCENVASRHGVVAVHSSSGLGRAAFCVACFLIKHHQFTAQEAIGWLRFCCPGAIPSWYEAQLEQWQAALQRDGEELRSRNSQDEQTLTGGNSTMANRRSLDDLALTGGRLTSQISIGKMSLGRDSLLGTKEKTSAREKDPSVSNSYATGTDDVPSFHTRAPPRSSGSYKELQATQQLIASDATLAKRRPATQGAAGRRRLLDHHHNYHHQHHRGSDVTGAGSGTRDFAAIHKFLHQSTPSSSSTTNSSSAVAPSSVRSCSSGTAYSGSHISALRPAMTAPDRSILSATVTTTTSTTTTSMSSHSKAELTVD